MYLYVQETEHRCTHVNMFTATVELFRQLMCIVRCHIQYMELSHTTAPQQITSWHLGKSPTRGWHKEKIGPVANVLKSLNWVCLTKLKCTEVIVLWFDLVSGDSSVLTLGWTSK